VVLLLLFWLYPLLSVVRSKPLHRSWGAGFGVASIVAAVAFLLHASNKQIAFFHANVVGNGAWLFLGASILYFLGIILYRPSAAS